MSSYEGLCPDCQQVECDEACMKATSNVKLLPLPEPSGDYTNPYDGDGLENYARANVAHATAAKDAEIEALRAEVADLRGKWSHAESNLAACDSDLRVFQQRAERLAEALREALALARDGAAEVNGATDYMPAGKAFDITKRRSGELFNRLAELEARAALEQETTNG